MTSRLWRSGALLNRYPLHCGLGTGGPGLDRVQSVYSVLWSQDECDGSLQSSATYAVQTLTRA